MANRPLLNHSLDALEKLFLDKGDDLRALNAMVEELDHRKTAGAVRLTNRVKTRLSELQRQQVTRTGGKTKDPAMDEISLKTAESLQEIRKKLLDLSRRNTLLNYKHPRNRAIRVADEMPDQLFAELMAGKAFVFEPLPRVPLLDERLSVRTREFLERLPDPRRPPVQEWAKFNGVDPSYELPAPGSSEKRHRDLSIQTLLLPRDLESRLRTMSQLARTAIEESGANILYLAFGFLEWRESEDSDQASLAPLVLVPVTLKKEKGLDPKTRRERFSVEYSGEDIQTNLSLRERISRDFSLSLPELEEDDSPETYINRCRKLLRAQPRWRILRYVTLGFFQFGKLMMYLDLDPDRWPKRAGIAEHFLIRRILGGEPFDAGGIVSEVDVDSIPMNAPEVQLVEEADSSQHGAIIEATQGRSLVIEGPPGTGKSQTITNIIGVALAQGKSVLFVSEKLAALEVVKSRLEASGLGDFCLELHSHKTRKRKFLDDLARRIRRRRRALSIEDIDKQRKRYKRIRDQIAAYIRLVNQSVAEYDGSFHALFCEAAWLEDRLRAAAVQLDPSMISIRPGRDVLALTNSSGAAVVAARKNIVDRCGSMAGHSWFGFIPLFKTPDVSESLKRVTAWSNGLRILSQSAEALNANERVPKLRTYGDLDRAATLAEVIPIQALKLYKLDRALRAGEEAEPLKKLLDWEERIAREFSRAESMWQLSEATPVDLWDRLQPTIESLKLNSADLTERTLNELIDIRDCLERIAAQAGETAAGIIGASRNLAEVIPANVEGLALVREALVLAAECPTAALGHRSQVLETIQDVSLLEELSKQRTDLLRESAKLSLQFDLAMPLDINQLEAVRAVLEKTTWHSVLDSEWRSANSTYQSLRLKRSLLRSKRSKVGDLLRLEAFTKADSEFCRNARYIAALGPKFIGKETPADEYLALCRWFSEIKSRLGVKPDVRGRVGRVLMRHTEEALGELRDLHHTALPASIAFVVDALEKLEGRDEALGAWLLRDWWEPFPQRAAETAVLVRRATEELYSVQTTEGSDLSIADGAASLERLSSMMKSSGRVTLQDRFLTAGIRGIWSQSQIDSGRAILAVQDALDGSDRASPIRQTLAMLGSVPELPERFATVAKCLRACREAQSAIGECFLIDEQSLFGAKIVDAHWSEVSRRVEAAIDPSTLPEWINVARPVDALVHLDVGFEQLRSLAFRDEVNDEALRIAPRALALSRLASTVIESEPKLRDFSTEKHEKLLAKFRKADDHLQNLAQEQIAATAMSVRPPEGQTGRKVADLTEIQLIRHEIPKQRKHLPIRKTMVRAGNALKALKPCFMMGPLSVAQYIQPGGLTFDIAIMDEASQMRPEDALGTIARCRQLIVVGDPKQLPPTSFFDRLSRDDSDADPDEELVFGTQESILDIASPLFTPTKTLAWHYRSRHEALIAFSNFNFYDKKLLLFPTANASSAHLGLRYKRVEGLYSNHVNIEEAQALIRAVIREVRSGRRRSIGIAAVNVQQAQAIRDEWDRVTREFPDLQELLYQDDSNLQGLFIKNLENVQGDERDVIFISLTYGKDRNGNFYQRFGPINRSDGWRRLNVLFTRAKEQMVVFSSMDSTFIAPTSSSSRGVVALRDFLQYCETGVVPEAAGASGRGPDSPFEEDVAAVVRQFGLSATYQVGVAGFFVDIGVTHPDMPGQYLLGIECDGATYHSSQSVRDRDKIRQSVLENLGWKIQRIWSTDWFKDGDKERARLRAVLEQARIEAQQRQAEISARETADHTATDLPREEPNIPTQVEEEPGPPKGDTNLRERLREMRELISEEFPDTPKENSLLHDEVIEALLRRRPITLEEFHRCLPLQRRRHIDVAQSATYLSTILALVEDNL